MSADSNRPLMCPSAQASMPDAQVLGLVTHDGEQPRVAYLNERVPVTPALLAQTGAVAPDTVLRFAATCETSRCTHFDGAQCKLATRIVEMLPDLGENLPPCIIRRDCRWYRQEGRAACARCPQVVTRHDAPTDLVKAVALPV